MSRCPVCNSKGDCLEYCGWNESDIREEYEQLKEQIQALQKENAELRGILKDFLTTKECKDTWIYEMHATIEAVLNDRLLGGGK